MTLETIDDLSAHRVKESVPCRNTYTRARARQISSQINHQTIEQCMPVCLHTLLDGQKLEKSKVISSEI